MVHTVPAPTFGSDDESFWDLHILINALYQDPEMREEIQPRAVGVVLAAMSSPQLLITLSLRSLLVGGRSASEESSGIRYLGDGLK